MSATRDAIKKLIDEYKAKPDDMQNILSGGRNLLEVLDTQTLLQAGPLLKTLADTHDRGPTLLGDWLEIALDYGSGPVAFRFEIAAYDHYFEFLTGDNATTCGLGSITFMCTKMPVTMKMDENASAEEPHRTCFRSTLNTFLQTLAPQLEAALGTQLKAARLPQFVNIGTAEEPGWKMDPPSEENITLSDNSRKVFLPSVIELTGLQHSGRETGDISTQLPLTRLVATKRVGIRPDGSFYYEWTRTPTFEPGTFCTINDTGRVIANAAYIGRGVRPMFCL